MSNTWPELVDEGTPETIAGDPNDKDASVIDSLYRDNALPATQPAPEEMAPYAPNAKLIQAKPLTRCMTGVINMNLGDEAQMLLPPDPRRRELFVKVAPTVTITDHVLVGDDRGKVQSDMGAFSLYQGERWNTNEPHTGPVWVRVSTLVAGPIAISYLAITE